MNMKQYCKKNTLGHQKLTQFRDNNLLRNQTSKSVKNRKEEYKLLNVVDIRRKWILHQVVDTGFDIFTLIYNSIDHGDNWGSQF